MANCERTIDLQLPKEIATDLTVNNTTKIYIHLVGVNLHFCIEFDSYYRKTMNEI